VMEACCIAAASGLLGVVLGRAAASRQCLLTRQVSATDNSQGDDGAAVADTGTNGEGSDDYRGTRVCSFDNWAPLQMNSLQSFESCADITVVNRKMFGLGGFCTRNRTLLCMVGLPARGKSYINLMLMRYLRWTGFPVESFNAGNYRRKDGLAGADAAFFSADENAQSKREQLASLTMDEAIAWLDSKEDVSVAIFDATNTTQKRRKKIIECCSAHAGITPLFVESICDDPKVLEANYNLKLGNDDYKNMDPLQARADFLQRIKNYEERYETIRDEEHGGEMRYIKVFNVGQKVILRRCDGYAASHIGFYLSNIHITPRRIWLLRHAQTRDQENGILGSVSGKLTRAGRQYGRRVAAHVSRAVNQIEGDEGRKVLVLMGTAPVHQATCDALTSDRADPDDVEARAVVEAARSWPVMSTSLLNELDGGDCNGMSYDQIRTQFPAVWDAREKDKLNFRYPGAGGESYIDVINRLRPVIIELERHKSSLLIISHLAVQRCIYAYFMGCSMEELPYIEMDMHTVYELSPGPFGTQVQAVPLGGLSQTPSAPTIAHTPSIN